MDVITIAKKMSDKIEQLEKARERLDSLAQLTAEASALYDKVIALEIIKLRNGVPAQMGEWTIVDPPVTIMEKIVKGLCYQEKLEMDKTDAMYKAETTNIKSIQAELNGLQSINRYLGEV